MTEIFISNKDLTDLQKSLIFLKMSQVDLRLNNGSDEQIQLLYLFIIISNIFNGELDN